MSQFDSRPEDAAVKETLGILDEYRKGVEDTVGQLQDLIEKLQRDIFPDNWEVGKVKETLEELAVEQEKLCRAASAILPAIDCSELSSIEKSLTELAKTATLFEGAKQALREFLSVSSDRQEAIDALESCKARAQELLDGITLESANTIYPPYALFVDVVKDQGLEVTEEQADIIETEFPKPVSRFLWRGQYCLSEHSQIEMIAKAETYFEGDSVENAYFEVSDKFAMPNTEIEDDPQEDAPIEFETEPELDASDEVDDVFIEDAKSPAFDNSNYEFSTSDKKFVASSFIKNYAKKDSKGEWKFVQPCGFEVIKFLYSIGSSYVLSKEQIADLIDGDEGIVETAIGYLLRDGLIIEILNNSKDDTLFCLSANGHRAFTQASSRELITTMGTNPPNCYILDSDLKAGNYSVQTILSLNEIALYLLKTVDPFFEEEMGISSESTLLHNIVEGFPIAVLETKTKAGNTVFTWITDNQKLVKTIDHATQDGFTPNSNNILCISNNPSSFVDPDFTEFERLFYASWDYESGSLNLRSSSGVLMGEPVRSLFEIVKEGAGANLCTTKPQPEVPQEDTATPEARDANDDSSETVVEKPASVIAGQSPTGPIEMSEHESTIDEKPNEMDIDIQVDPETSPAVLARQILSLDLTPQTAQDEFLQLIDRLLTKGKPDIGSSCLEKGSFCLENNLIQALFLLKTLSLDGESTAYGLIYKRLLLALDSRLEEHTYSGESLVSLYGSEQSNTALHLAALLRTLFAPSIQYDFSLVTYRSDVLRDYDNIFPHYIAAKPLYNLLNRALDISPSGFSPSVLRRFTKGQEHDAEIQMIRERATGCMDEPNIQAKMRGMPKLMAMCFGPESDLGKCMRAISEGTISEELIACVFEIFSEAADKRKLVVSDSRIEEYIRDNWRAASAKEKTRNVELMGLAKKQLINAIKSRLDIIGVWMEATAENIDLGAGNFLKLEGLRDKVVDELSRLIEDFEHSFKTSDKYILLHMLKHLHWIIVNGVPSNYWEFAELLQTNLFPFDDDALPAINGEFNDVENYEPWRNALRHISTNQVNVKQALSSISDKNSPEFYDNIGIAITICRYLSYPKSESQKFKDDIQLALSRHKAATDSFMSYLGQALAYGRIRDDYREDILLVRDGFDQYFVDTNCFGCYQSFLRALKRSIEIQSKRREEELLSDIEKRISNISTPIQNDILNRAKQKLFAPERNYVVTEDLINRFDSGDSVEAFFDDSDDSGEFLKFIQEDNFNELRRECADNKTKMLNGFGPKFVEKKLAIRGVSHQYQDGARHLLKSIPGSREALATEKVRLTSNPKRRLLQLFLH
jgi:hypothetical protein